MENIMGMLISITKDLRGCLGLFLTLVVSLFLSWFVAGLLVQQSLSWSTTLLWLRVAWCLILDERLRGVHLWLSLCLILAERLS